MSRSLKIRQEAFRRLEQFIEELRNNGEALLPSERKLCEHIDCSRDTIRHILNTAETKKKIIRQDSKRLIPQKPLLNTTVSFVTAGWEDISNSTWASLYHTLIPLAVEAGIDVKLTLINRHTPVDSCLEKIDSSTDYIVFTNSPTNELKNKFFSVREQYPIICTDEAFINTADYLVCLDNFKAGTMAASCLLDRGYSKPAMISTQLKDNKYYRPFAERIRGFEETMKKAGISVHYEEFNTFTEKDYHTNYYAQLDQCCKSIAKQDLDSLFIIGDKGVEIAYKAIMCNRNIPDDFGLLVLNSSNECLEHIPIVSSISHATREVASEIVKLIGKLQSNPGEMKQIIKRAPTFNPGATLRKITT